MRTWLIFLRGKLQFYAQYPTVVIIMVTIYETTTHII